ncbi:transcriptional regulator domain-containing protein [Sphingopyxis sp. GC21]|uniref:transcriptional regulator domain-containing protein n=1 Tax=Sphingopyxis sp. GC21 TaxID=2933562 RepID=UPI00398FD2CE
MMWEWLRRDPAYVAWYTSASKATRDQKGRAGSLQWGLHFRRGSGPRISRCTADLGCVRRSWRAAGFRGTGRSGDGRPV